MKGILKMAIGRWGKKVTPYMNSIPSRDDTEVFNIQQVTSSLFFEDRLHSLPDLNLLPVGLLQKVGEGVVGPVELDVPVPVRHGTLFAGVRVHEGEHQDGEGGKFSSGGQFHKIGHFYETSSTDPSRRNENPFTGRTFDPQDFLVISQFSQEFAPMVTYGPVERLGLLS